MIYFTSDTHFGHENVIHFSKRPFANASYMDEALIRNWNNRVTDKDDVWHLGDFNFRSESGAERYRKLLRGRVHIVWGNHDKLTKRFAHLFQSTPELKVDGQKFVLCHYAMRVWRSSHHGAIHLYGHSHGSLPDDPNALSMDVGVDCTNYTPISLPEVLERMKTKTWRPVDHHYPRTCAACGAARNTPNDSCTCSGGCELFRMLEEE